MDVINNKVCIVNASVGGGWYPKGTDRLVNSLNFVGWAGDVLTWKDEWPNDNYNKKCPYNVKASALEEALKQNYTHILWLDCSIWAIKDPMSIFDLINDKGYFFWTSGFNCAQTCSDKCLDYFGVTRDEAEKMTEISSGIFGFNTNNPLGNRFIHEFIKAAKDRVFEGSRNHDNQSRDKRFLFHRQDQSAASLIVNKLGLDITQPREYAQYWNSTTSQEKVPDSLVFLMRGL